MAVMQPPTIALFAKYPAAGAAKTRLIPALGPEGAAQVHRLLVERTIATIRHSGLPFAVYFSGAPREDFAAWLGDDVALVEQGEGDLGDRLTRVAAPAILLGADIPGLTPRHLQQAASALDRSDAVVGPAQDGGYYLLGFRQRLPFLFTDMEWGTASVLDHTLARLKAQNIAFTLLDMLADCDRPADLAHYPNLLP
ncbi:TIGR04282 family arsenosugar biosynthesis glycosyltransferase [Alteraurantiacibacter aestuarii]|nr:TIGR04282 family arsenosugar biosynthesis glycosyltransferase [Alteraurantiacibacter aestuarii]